MLITEQASQWVTAFNAQGLANTLWTRTMVNRLLPGLSDLRHRAAEATVRALNASGFANTLWALTTADRVRPRSSPRQAAAAAMRVFTAQSLTNTLRAMTAMDRVLPETRDSLRHGAPRSAAGHRVKADRL